jgi:hypothetical protein
VGDHKPEQHEKDDDGDVAEGGRLVEEARIQFPERLESVGRALPEVFEENCQRRRKADQIKV